MCDEGIVEDEFHVILNCSKYSDLRQVCNEIHVAGLMVISVICLHQIKLYLSYQMKLVFVSELSSSVILNTCSSVRSRN